MRVHAIVALLVTCIVMCTASVTATAQANPLKRKPNSPAAKEHLEQGNRYYRILEYDKAIEEYKAGAAVEGHEIFYYNLAQAFRMTSRYSEAIPLYQQWLMRAKPTGRLREAVEKHIEEMSAELSRRASTREPTGPAPDEPAQDRPVPSPVEAAISYETRKKENQRTAERGEHWYGDTVGWITVGFGLVLVGVGTGLLVTADGLSIEAKQEPSERRRTQLRDSAHTRTTWGYVALPIGAAAMITGTVKLAIFSSNGPRASVQATFVVAPNGLAIAGRF